MKSSRAEIHRRVHAIPELRFDDHRMTSFSGLVIFQRLFKQLDLKARLRHAFGDADRARSFGLATVVMQLVVQVLLGFRRFRDSEYFANDPLVCRILGLAKLPDVGTISRTLAAATPKCVTVFRGLVRQLVLDRLAKLKLATVTLDFDGSVLSTRRHAEGSAVGYNKKRKGARSYYPLFCTVAQTGQFLDMWHRPGNVHDSRDSETFITEKVEDVRRLLPSARIETRLDSAFFSEQTLALLQGLGAEYSVSVPFERFPALIRQAAREVGGTAQVAGGVPAMCDGVTQGEAGMELSLFSRDVIALGASVALSHNTFDAAVFLGVCDKIVPGLVIAAATVYQLHTAWEQHESRGEHADRQRTEEYGGRQWDSTPG